MGASRGLSKSALGNTETSGQFTFLIAIFLPRFLACNCQRFTALLLSGDVPPSIVRIFTGDRMPKKFLFSPIIIDH